MVANGETISNSIQMSLCFKDRCNKRFLLFEWGGYCQSAPGKKPSFYFSGIYSLSLSGVQGQQLGKYQTFGVWCLILGHFGRTRCSDSTAQ